MLRSMLVTYQQRSFIHCLSFCLLFFVLFWTNQNQLMKTMTAAYPPSPSTLSVAWLAARIRFLFAWNNVQHSTIKTKTEIIHRNLNGFHIEFRWIKPRIVKLFRSFDTIEQNNMREFFPYYELFHPEFFPVRIENLFQHCGFFGMQTSFLNFQFWILFLSQSIWWKSNISVNK